MCCTAVKTHVWPSCVLSDLCLPCRPAGSEFKGEEPTCICIHTNTNTRVHALILVYRPQVLGGCPREVKCKWHLFFFLALLCTHLTQNIRFHFEAILNLLFLTFQQNVYTHPTLTSERQPPLRSSAFTPLLCPLLTRPHYIVPEARQRPPSTHPPSLPPFFHVSPAD